MLRQIKLHYLLNNLRKQYKIINVNGCYVTVFKRGLGFKVEERGDQQYYNEQ